MACWRCTAAQGPLSRYAQPCAAPDQGCYGCPGLPWLIKWPVSGCADAWRTSSGVLHSLSTHGLYHLYRSTQGKHTPHLWQQKSLLSTACLTAAHLQAVTYQQDPAAADPLQPVRSPLYQLGRLAPLGSRPAAAAAAAQGAAASQHAAAAARATPKLENSPPPSKKQRRCSVLDLCGSQLQTYHEELPAQRHVYNAYVDGSHRQKPWPAAVSMSAGGFLRGPPGVYGPRDFFDFSLLLVGGPPGSWLSDPPGSMISEMGAIWIGCGRLQKAIAAGSIVTSTSQVHMHTDCQQAANLLKRKGVRLPPKLVPLIAGEAPGRGRGQRTCCCRVL